MTVSRRALLEAVAATTLAGSLVLPALAEDTPAPAPAAPKPAEEAKADLSTLLDPDKLPEIVMGDDKAPVTIVEYHSMTCPHCAHFHETVLPTLDEKYIKTGKVRLILRGFPLNQLDAVAFMMLRCRPQTAYLDNVKLFYGSQKDWAFTDKPKEAITALGLKIGFTQETFEACLKDDATWDGLVSVAKKAAETYKVNGTPSFFINGTDQGSIVTVDELDKKLAAFLK